MSILIEKPDGARLELISYDKTTPNVASTDGNISLFYADFFASLAAPAGSTFGLVDNVFASQIPEPSTLALAVLGALGMLFGFRRRS